jgi:predicted dehydrogenase
VRVLIVGFGSIGRRHLSNVRQLLPDAHTTIWRHARAVEAEQPPTGADQLVYSLPEALSSRPDVAILASPAPFHVPAAAALAAAGVHLMIEKPLSDSLNGIDDLIQESTRRGIVLMVGYHLRFSPSLISLHKAITDGSIGRLISLRAEVGQYLPDWRPGADYRKGVSARRELGGGVVLELSHELDYVGWLAGEVSSVHAEMAQLGDLDVDVEDVAEIVLRFSNGAIGSVHVDMVQRAATRSCRVVGTKGTLTWDGLRGHTQLFSVDRGEWIDLYGPSDAGVNEMYLAELTHFFQSVIQGGDVPVDGAAGRRVLELALAAKRSAAAGQTVSMQGESRA